jgi:sulfate transport system ATP-binding protein
MSISARNVCKKFGDFVALDNVTVDAPSGALVALLGPSGSGKTTLLRIIAGLEVADSGTIVHHEADVTGRTARDRNVGFVFQHYALFRHMTVFENVAFALRVRKWDEKRLTDRVTELLHLVRLETMADRYPSQLSGGQKQRIALVRALAAEPKVILLDEPFGALDAKVRTELRTWLRRFHDQFHVTSLFVTHDQEEAFEVADQIVVMNNGRVEQAASPKDVFEHPANAFVMDFLGNVNIFPAKLQDGRAVLGDVVMPVAGHKMVPTGSGTADVYVRPHELDIDRTGTPGNSMRGQIIHINPAGSAVKVRVRADDFGLVVNVDITQERYRQLKLGTGDWVFVSPKTATIFEYDYEI